MLSLQALAVFVLALSGDVVWAVLSSFFIYFTHATLGGVTYPVMLLGFPFTYGIIGLSYMLLAIALLGAGRVRAGAVLLGFGPAVHPTLGVLCLVAGAVAAGRGSALRRHHRSWPYFLAGLVAAASSAAFHYLRSDLDLRQTGAGLGASSSFTHYWGQAHRRPFPLLAGGMLLVWANLGLSVFWLGPFRDDIPAHARTMLKILLASALVGTVLSIPYWLPPASVPNVALALMPSRLLNLHIMTAMALVIGLAWRYRDSVWIQATLTTVVVVVCLVHAAGDGDEYLAARFGIALGGPALIVLAALRRRGAGKTAAPPWLPIALRRVTRLAPATILRGRSFAIRASTGSATPGTSGYATAARRPGLLLTAADIHLIQLHTRRPVLLDGGALDGLPYIPEAVAQADTILRRVYGIDTVRDVPEGEDIGGLWPDAGKALWEARTSAEWKALAHEFGVTDVLTYAGWRLRLPVIDRSSDFIHSRPPPPVMPPSPPIAHQQQAGVRPAPSVAAAVAAAAPPPRPRARREAAAGEATGPRGGPPADAFPPPPNPGAVGGRRGAGAVETTAAPPPPPAGRPVPGGPRRPPGAAARAGPEQGGAGPGPPPPPPRRRSVHAGPRHPVIAIKTASHAGDRPLSRHLRRRLRSVGRHRAQRSAVGVRRRGAAHPRQARLRCLSDPRAEILPRRGRRDAAGRRMRRHQPEHAGLCRRHDAAILRRHAP